MDRHLVGGEIVVDEEAETLVDREFLHQGRAHAHGHRADDLAARRLGIEDTAGGAHGEHAPHARLTGRGVDADFDEVRPERRLMKFLVEIAEFDSVLGGHAGVARGLAERHLAIA